MAVSDTTEDSEINLTHRLVGACVLVAIAVIILPMLLSGEDVEEYSITSLPNPVQSDDEDFVSKITPRDENENQTNSTAAAQSQNDLQSLLDRSGQGNDQTSGQNGVSESTQNTAALDPDPAPKDDAGATNAQTGSDNLGTPADPDAAGDGRGWIVRVGTFKETANANQIMQALRDKGFEPQSADVDTGVGRATRVWVGPYSKRVTASRILNRLEGEIGEKGFISAYP